MKNNFITKIIGATLAAAMMIGVGAGLNYSQRASEVHADNGSISAFTGTSGDIVDGVVSYACYKGDGTTAPVYAAGYLRIYKPASGKSTGGYITVSTADGYYLTSVTFTSSGDKSGTVKTSVNGGGLSSSRSITSTGSVTVDNVVATSVSIYNCGSDRLSFSSINVVYTDNAGEIPPTTYTVTYHENNKTSGSAPTDATEYEEGDTITVAGNTGNLAREGYTWSGWSINQNGSGTAYGPAPYTTTYTVGTSNVDFYPIWVKNVTPFPESGTISITGNNPTIGSYGENVAYVVQEDNTPGTEFGFKCTQIMKNGENLQFKASQGVLYSTTPLQYIRNVTVSGENSSDAVIRYGTAENSGCTRENVGSDSTYFKVSNPISNARYWTITVTYSLETPAALTGLRIASGLDSVRKTYDDGESFDPTGLVVQAQWNDTWDVEHNVLNNVTWAPTVLTGGTTLVTGTYTYGTDSETVTVDGLTVASPNVIIDGDSNKPDGLGTNTSTTASGQGQINSTGVNYGYYGLAIYQSTNNLEFNRSVSGAYIGNNESYGKYIRKIRLTLNSAEFTKLTMYKGDSAIPGTTSVSTESNSGVTRIYNMGNNCEFFALKQTTTGTWIQIVKMEIFLGSNVPAVSSIDATVNGGTYYAGSTLSSSDFNVTAHWTEGKADTNPTSEFTWTVNGVPNGTLNEGNNSVVVSYKGASSSPINVVGAHRNAKDVIEDTITTSSSLAYHYNKTQDSTTDTLTHGLIGVDSTSYTSWSGKTDQSNAVYAGQSAGGDTTSGDAIQIRSNNSNSGIITTTSGGFAKKVTVSWKAPTAEGRTIDVYGKNTVYSNPTDLYNNSNQGTKLGSIVNGTSTELTITGEYAFIGLRSASGAIYLETIEIEWLGEPTYSYSNISMRFGGSIDKDLWDELDTNENPIAGVGVLITGYEEQQRSPYSIKDHYAEAINFDEVTNIKTQVGNCYVSLNDFNIPEKNNEYYWNLKYEIASINDMLDSYTAAAYIKLTNGDLVFLKQVKYSVWSLAKDYLDNRNCNEETADGSLYNIVASAGLE